MAPSSRDREGRAGGRPQAPSRARAEEVADENLDVGRAIQQLRGLRSQVEVAALAKLNRSTWSLYESGRRKPSSDKLDRVLTALGCSRLQFEETVWSFRRLRLVEEQAKKRPAATHRPAGSGGLTPRGSPGLARAEPLPPDLQTLHARASALLGDFLGFLAKAASGSRR